MQPDPVSLEIFRHLFAAVAEEMGVTLGRTAYSPNIKERRDFSCALFDDRGQMVAQAAHIPVHLGSMPASVQAALNAVERWQPGDVVILNDPFLGGTHLPDITLVSPVFLPGEADAPAYFVASRAHHADVGGMAPGSMSTASEIYQEGLIIPPMRLAEAGRLRDDLIDLICRNVRTPEERRGDLDAQLAAHRVGEARLLELVERYGPATVQAHAAALLDYAERLTRARIADIPDGTYRFIDYMDDDGRAEEPVPIQVAITVAGDELTVDFTGTAQQRPGPINCPLAVTQSAVLYVLHCLFGGDVPANAGVSRPVQVIAPPGSLVNATPPAAVAGGNVETSQRIVDALLGALAQALPERIPAASQGTMNNLAAGGFDADRERSFAYYETLGGGGGGRPTGPGVSGRHSHMTNTLNTPIEAIEFSLPLRVRRYALRPGSGGAGRHSGGDGIIREIEFLAPATVSLLTERRRLAPYGLHGGSPGARGRNRLRRAGSSLEETLPGKVTFEVAVGDVLTVETPGGGGWGVPAG
ncbi:MAG: hydantoinase B/oxoprolinase family protein, partial [Anaerolineae bacterium]|nr:hydantoinase B/oxoprolinase family protein [Anaerolineae bacterium]